MSGYTGDFSKFNNASVVAHFLWKVTLMALSPSVMPEVASLAVMAAFSSSYSTNAIPARPGTSRISM